MRITYLREFVEVGLSLNLSKAAKSLHMSQPSLSKHIAALEQECGTPLLSRTSSRIQLTPAGQVLFEEACLIIRMHDNALERIRTLKDVAAIRVAGLFESAPVLTLLNRTAATLNAERTTVALSYQDYRHRPPIEQLQKDRIDLVVTILAPHEETQPGIGRVLLFHDPMVCLARRGTPLAERDTMSVAELAGQTILQPVGSYSTEHGRSTVSEIFARYGISPKQKPVFVHSISEFSTIDKEEGVLIMERSMLSAQPFSDDYRVIEIAEPDVSFAFYALHREQSDNLALPAFVKQLAACAEEARGRRGAG